MHTSSLYIRYHAVQVTHSVALDKIYMHKEDVG